MNDQQETQPKAYENFIIKTAPYVVIVEIIFWIWIFLLTSPGFYLLSHTWRVIGPVIKITLPENLFNSLGIFVVVYVFEGPIIYCNLFTSYEGCSPSIEWGNHNSPPIPSAYTSFIYSLVAVVVPVVIALKVLTVYWLFKKEKMAWKGVFNSSLVIAILLLVSRNILGFMIYILLVSLVSLYPLFQVKKYYK